MAEMDMFSEALSEEIRSRFYHVDSDPLSGERIWFESASGSLRLKAMIEALAMQTRWGDNLGRTSAASTQAGAVITQGIEDVRTFLGARSGQIMGAMSSTHAMFRIVNAVLGASQGGNVVTTNLEHPAVFDSTTQFAAMYGNERRVAAVNPSTGFVEAETILNLVDKDTVLVAMMHGSNVTGALLDVETVAREARRINPDVFVVIDGVQYAPHAPVDVEALGVDAYVFGPYKAFCVKGIAFAFLSDRISELDHWQLQGKPMSDWTLGSPEDATYAAWSAVVDYLCWLGSHFTNASDRRSQVTAAMEAAEAHNHVLLERLLHGTPERDGLLSMEHVTIHGLGEDLAHRTCLVLFNLDGVDSWQGVELYNRARIRLHNRVSDVYSKHVLEGLGITEGIRMSACHYNTAGEIDRFLDATAAMGAMSAEELAAVPGQQESSGPGEG